MRAFVSHAAVPSRGALLPGSGAACGRRSERRRPRRRPRAPRAEMPPNFKFGTEPPLDEGRRHLASLDAEEAALRSAPAQHRLTDRELEMLFDAVPELAQITAGVNKMMADDPTVDLRRPTPLLWAWERVRPRRSILIARVVIVLSVLGGCASAARSWFMETGAAAAAGALVRADFVSSAVMLGIAAPALLGASLAKPPLHSDAPRRVMMAFCACVLLTVVPAGMLASAGFPVASQVVGVAARLAILPASLWMWSDLNQELFTMRVCRGLWMARWLHWWRVVLSAVVLLGGGVLRLVTFFGTGMGDSIRESMIVRAATARTALAAQFPIMLSLCADTGGVATLSWILVGVMVAYTVYIVVFATDYLRVLTHREANPAGANFWIDRGVFLPNELTERESLLSTASRGTPPYFPLPSMMLRQPPTLIDVGGAIRSNETPRFLQLLDEEEVVMKNKGMPRWNPPRTEFLPLENGLTEGQRSRMALSTWARPLTDLDGSSSFTDFFESIHDDAEYEFDPDTENWVFTKDSKWRQAGQEDEDRKASPGESKTEGDKSVRDDSEPPRVVEFKFPGVDEPDAGTFI